MPDSPPPSYAASQALCSTCAQQLYFGEKEKEKDASPAPLQHACCSRWVCSSCLVLNPRFATYCAFCPTSSRILPPSYDCAPSQLSAAGGPSISLPTPPSEGYVLHHLQPTDTLSSLSLAYNIPLPVLRQYNSLFSDHLLAARATLRIPQSHYAGPSLSDRPREGEERNVMRRRFMLRTKCAEWDMAEAYLRDAEWELERAIERWRGDEEWMERERADAKGSRGKQKADGVSGWRRIWR